MTYRNRALLDLCHEAPCLLLPGQHECLGGPSEPAHSDMIRHGRGEHHKSHDCFAVPGCHNAHLAFNRANLGKDGYHAAWTEAMERYILWLWVSDGIRITERKQPPKEHAMEAPMCKICEHRHYVRDPNTFGKNTSASEAKDRKVENARRDSSANSSSSRITAQAGGTPVKNSIRSLRGQQHLGSGSKAMKDGSIPSDRATNTSREGRRVLKAEAARPDATRTAATANARPASLPRKTGGDGTAAKPKTAPKKKGKK
jgi:hypothetical protein